MLRYVLLLLAACAVDIGQDVYEKLEDSKLASPWVESSSRPQMLTRRATVATACDYSRPPHYAS